MNVGTSIHRYFELGRRAFSLIEINIAILVVAGGLLVIMAVFPTALRLSGSATSETRQSVFATTILNVARDKALNFSVDIWTDRTSVPEPFQLGLEEAITDYLKEVYGSVDQAKAYLNITDYRVMNKASTANGFTRYILVQSTDTPDVSVSNSTPYQLTVHYHP